MCISDSQTDEWLDRDVLRRLLGTLPGADPTSVGAKRTARQIWTVLVFMIWHGIFVEERIKPDVPETVYPVRL